MDVSSVSHWIGVGAVALASILWAEIVRDVRHWLAHRWPWLMPKHILHHRLFRPDLSVVDAQLYRESQWHHDVPEAATMILAGIPWVVVLGWGSLLYGLAAAVGVVYSASFWVAGMLRGWGLALQTDITHQPGPFPVPPSQWHVNRAYHWRHHFDDTNAYFCGTLTLVDRLMGTSLSLKGKRVAVTGASGTLGRALLKHFHQQGAKVIALSSHSDSVHIEVDGQIQPVETVRWQVGQEGSLAELLERVDILVLNHGFNVHGDRDPEAIRQSYAVNTFSSWRLMELFFQTVRSNPEMATKEVWVNTSEAEAQPCFQSPLRALQAGPGRPGYPAPPRCPLRGAQAHPRPLQEPAQSHWGYVGRLGGRSDLGPGQTRLPQHHRHHQPPDLLAFPAQRAGCEHLFPLV
jgi:hypothetical protein